MKVRVCPKCGKHNLENAFSCADCGATLSMKTLMDIGSGQLLGVEPIAGQSALWEISSFFEQDVYETLNIITEVRESIVWGHDLSQMAQEDPLRESDPIANTLSGFFGGEKITFLFGYFIVTSTKLICVYFECKTDKRGFPKRECFAEPRMHTESSSLLKDPLKRDRYLVLPIPAVDSPRYPLTDDEKKTRKVAIYELGDLISVREFDSIIDHLLRVLKLRFKSNEEVEFAFKIPDESAKAYKLFSASLGK